MGMSQELLDHLWDRAVWILFFLTLYYWTNPYLVLMYGYIIYIYILNICIILINSICFVSYIILYCIILYYIYISTPEVSKLVLKFVERIFIFPRFWHKHGFSNGYFSNKTKRVRIHGLECVII